MNRALDVAIAGAGLVLSSPLLALSACNRGPTQVVHGRTVALKLTDYRITPQRVRVRPGRITFTVRNTSRLPHNWQVAGRGKVRARIRTMLPAVAPRSSITHTTPSETRAA